MYSTNPSYIINKKYETDKKNITFQVENLWGKKKIIIKSVKKENSTAQAEFSEPSSDLIPNSEFNTRK